MELEIQKLKNKYYIANSNNWYKWRLTYQGDDDYINQYLQKLSLRESDYDFNIRKTITHCPRFSGAAIDDVKNSIYQRMVDIKRVGGSLSYQQAIKGLNGGVDNENNSMDTFIGQKILLELILMGQVGVFVDMPNDLGKTIYENKNKRPYLYSYCVEDIYNICHKNGEVTNLLVRDFQPIYDDVTGFEIGEKILYRRMWIGNDGYVHLIFYEESDGELIVPIQDELILPLTKIPFIIGNLSISLMANIANHQRTLLNLESSDIAYILKANFPFYVENYDPASDNNFARGHQLDNNGNIINNPQASNPEITVGVSSGRRYPKGLNAPEFIHPSSEPLKISMEKQEKIKEDIRNLLNLSLSTLKPTYASAESKGMDNQSLESGLSYIGLELQRIENEIANLWSMYEGSDLAKITYPKKYSLKTENDRKEENKELTETISIIPSNLGKKELLKQIIENVLIDKVTDETLTEIKNEINASDYLTSDAKDIALDVENGLVTRETASLARGYIKGEAAKAKEQHAERLALIQKAQTHGFGDNLKVPKQRGVNDLDPGGISGTISQ